MFNQVVIRNQTEQAHNVHLAVHPFHCGKTRLMLWEGHYDDNEHKGDLPEWKQRLADALWAGIPGLKTLFFINGSIIIQHTGIFEDKDIIEAASSIIQPVLECNLKLMEID